MTAHLNNPNFINTEASDHLNAGTNARTMARFAACMINELKNITFDRLDHACRRKPKFELRIGEIVLVS